MIRTLFRPYITAVLLLFSSAVQAGALPGNEGSSASNDKVSMLMTEPERAEMLKTLRSWEDRAVIRKMSGEGLSEEDVRVIYLEFAGVAGEFFRSGMSGEAGASDGERAEKLRKAEELGKRTRNIFLSLKGKDLARFGRLFEVMSEALYLEVKVLSSAAGEDAGARERRERLYNVSVKEAERQYLGVAIAAWGVETKEAVSQSENGYGSATLPDGSVYEGYFENGLFNGKGKRTWKDGHTYEGEYKDGLAHGYGVETMSDGTRYEGGFRDGKWYGKGVIVWKDGNRYDVSNP